MAGEPLSPAAERAADRIIACAQKNPTWSRRQIARHLGVNDSYAGRVLKASDIQRSPRMGRPKMPTPVSEPSPQPATGVGAPQPNYMTALFNHRVGNEAQHTAARHISPDMRAQIEARVAAGQVTRIDHVARCTPEWPQRLNTRTSE